MRQAHIFVNKTFAAILIEHEINKKYEVTYTNGYNGNPISLTLPVRAQPYFFSFFPPFLEGLLPEGLQLEALLRQKKIDANDYFSQLVAVGNDLVGAISVKEIN